MSGKIQILIFVLTTACTHVTPAPVSECVTQCGLIAHQETADSCAALQAFETKTLLQFDRQVPGWTYSKTCPLLHGWQVLVHPADRNGAWESDDGSRILGLTIPEDDTILIGLHEWGDSALAHEIAHVIGIRSANDWSHDQWTERGICSAINRASDHFHCDYQHPEWGRPRW